LRNHSLGFRRIPSNNWAFSGLRLEFRMRGRPRPNKDSVTPRSFTDEHPGNHGNTCRPRVKLRTIWGLETKYVCEECYSHIQLLNRADPCGRLIFVRLGEIVQFGAFVVAEIVIGPV